MVSYEDFEVDQLVLALKVREIAAAQPDHVYRPDGAYGCNYTEADGTAGCIIGHAMAALGKKLPAYNSDAANYVYALVHGNICSDAWLEALGADKETELTGWLRTVQAHQDSLGAWGWAVAAADRRWPNAFNGNN